MKNVIVGTAGHIDHGKSALVLSLTGTDPDRLEEEKRRGITIDLGFAHLELGDVRLGFVDVPGHERFVRNMLAGATGIDVVLLVVAADESIKPQTREHFDICRLLGVERGLVAITKSDLVDRDLIDTVRLEIQEFVAGSFLEGAPVVAVSARTGDGLEDLKRELARLSHEVSAKSADLPFRLPIDRAFVMKGFGTVVTGTLVAGRVGKEAEVEVFPLGRRVRVRGIEVHNQSATEAHAGQRTALNLAGIDASEVARGMTLAEPGLFQASQRLDCSLTLLPSARPLKNRARVHFHCGTAETIAEVRLLGAKETSAALAPAGRTYAQVLLEAPGLFLPGDRFILRQFSPVTTLGGGAVLDPHPARHRLGDPGPRNFLERLDGAHPKARLEMLVRADGEASLASLVARTGWRSVELLSLARSETGARHLVLIGQPPSLLVHPEYFRMASESIVRTLEAFHRENPLLPGLPKEDLRARAAENARQAAATAARRSSTNAPPLSSALFNAALEQLSGSKRVETQGELVRLPGRTVQLSAEESAAKEQISRAFERAGLAVPSADEVLQPLPIGRARAQRILQILLREKTLVRVAEGLIFHASALAHLRQLLARRKAESDRLDVPAFKQMTGLSRKYAIPLLEYLDRERVTRRQGDERIIL